jgi:hypothetical protein
LKQINIFWVLMTILTSRCLNVTLKTIWIRCLRHLWWKVIIISCHRFLIFNYNVKINNFWVLMTILTARCLNVTLKTIWITCLRHLWWKIIIISCHRSLISAECKSNWHLTLDQNVDQYSKHLQISPTS